MDTGCCIGNWIGGGGGDCDGAGEGEGAVMGNAMGIELVIVEETEVKKVAGNVYIGTYSHLYYFTVSVIGSFAPI